MGPRIRFLLVISLLATLAWLGYIANEYMLGTRGLNFPRFLHGAFMATLAVLSGYLLVWISVRFMNFRENRKTGFEAILVDDSGTTFNMALSLSKFVPEIVAPLDPAQTSPLESELIGFLNSLGNWPYDLKNPSLTLREHALQLWAAMGSLPHAGPLHRSAALAVNLGKVYAYEEKRKAAPLWQFWKQEKVSYHRRSNEHGGMAAFILSQMPAFRQLGDGDAKRNQQERRALLTAVRYSKDPLKMPHNCEPLAREICEYLNLAHVKLQEMSGAAEVYNNPTGEDVVELNDSIGNTLPGLLTEMDFQPATLSQKREGFYLGHGLLAVSAPHLILQLVQTLSVDLRTTFHLWDSKNAAESLQPYLLEALRDHGWLVETWDDEPAHNGLFNFAVDGLPLPHCLLLNIQDHSFATLRKQLDLQPKLTATIDLHYTLEQRVQTIQHKAGTIDAELTSVFPR